MRTNILDAINEAGLKKKFVADKLGIGETYINQYLSKPNNITLRNALIICSLTGKSLNELDFGEENTFYFEHELQKK